MHLCIWLLLFMYSIKLKQGLVFFRLNWITKRCLNCQFCSGGALKAPPLLVGLNLSVLLKTLIPDEDSDSWLSFLVISKGFLQNSKDDTLVNDKISESLDSFWLWYVCLVTAPRVALHHQGFFIKKSWQTLSTTWAGEITNLKSKTIIFWNNLKRESANNGWDCW